MTLDLDEKGGLVLSVNSDYVCLRTMGGLCVCVYIVKGTSKSRKCRESLPRNQFLRTRSCGFSLQKGLVVSDTVSEVGR